MRVFGGDTVFREAIATGETVEQAIQNACSELGIESCGDNFEIIEMPAKKTLGIFGGNPAKVRVFVKENPAQAAADYLLNVLTQMGNENVTIDIQEEEGGAMLCVSGGDMGYMIGHRGETLDALQYLSGLIANQLEDSYYRITIDIGNYREKRRETLTVLGTKMANKALKTGRNYALEPMNPYERRIIHAAVQGVEGAKSWSEGEDLNRHIIIGPEGGERVFPKKRNYHKGKNSYEKKQKSDNTTPRYD